MQIYVQELKSTEQEYPYNHSFARLYLSTSGQSGNVAGMPEIIEVTNENDLELLRDELLSVMMVQRAKMEKYVDMLKEDELYKSATLFLKNKLLYC